MGVLANNVVLNRLRHGVPTEPFFDTRARSAYVIFFAALVGCCALVWWAGQVVAPKSVATVALGTSLLIAGAWMLRRVGHHRIGTVLEIIALSCAYAIIGLVAVIPAAVISFPLADSTLEAVDKAMGFDWLSWAKALEAYPILIESLRWAYASLAWQQTPVVVALVIAGQETRAWRFYTAMALALAVAIAVFALVPALDAFGYYGVNERTFPNLGANPMNVGRDIILLKNGQVHEITPGHFAGLISFPSFHAAAGVMLIWAAWSSKWLRWPFLALNFAMIVSTIFIGEHYLIDIIGGIALAGFAIAVSKRLVGECGVEYSKPRARPSPRP